MSEFSLKIIATNKIVYEGKATSVTIPTTDGEHGILAHHEDMIIAIIMGELRFTMADGEIARVLVGNGFIQIANNRVLILVESAERPEEIDVRRAKEARQRAEERLRQKMSQREYYHSQAALARALQRIKEAGKNSRV